MYIRIELNLPGSLVQPNVVTYCNRVFFSIVLQRANSKVMTYQAPVGDLVQKACTYTVRKLDTRYCGGFVCFFNSVMEYQMGKLVPSKFLLVVECGSQYYQFGNIYPVAILERYFSSVRWRFWQWKSEAISKSSFQESWGSIQAFFTPLEMFLFFCWALDLTNNFFFFFWVRKQTTCWQYHLFLPTQALTLLLLGSA